LIEHTFSVLPGIGEKLEQRIWQQSILSWNDFLAQPFVEGIAPARKHLYDLRLQEFQGALHAGDAPYFSRNVKRREHWRLFERFRGDVVCLDIETNGFHPAQGGYVTVIGLYDGFESITLVRGENLTVSALNQCLFGYKLLITFYGAGFDVPFMLAALPGVSFEMPHFDLCFAARRLGIDGGLKRIEQQFGLSRDTAVEGMNGYDAVLLWQRMQAGDPEARSLLLTYNREDTVNLLPLAELLYERLRASTGLSEYYSGAAYGCP